MSLVDDDGRTPPVDRSGEVQPREHRGAWQTAGKEGPAETSSLPSEETELESSGPVAEAGLPPTEWSWTPAIPAHPDGMISHLPAPPESLGSAVPAGIPAAEERGLWETVRPLIRETIETILLTAIIFLLIRSVAQNFRIEGYSMEPNFHDGQYLITDKISYRFHEIERGDVIVFEYPRAPQRDFIKRVIGLPGEKVEIRHGAVFINDKRLEEPYSPNPGSYSWGPEVVPGDSYFVLGDNRNNSSDSHTWGMLPRKNIVGKAWAIYWPPSNWGLVAYPRPTFASPN